MAASGRSPRPSVSTPDMPFQLSGQSRFPFGQQMTFQTKDTASTFAPCEVDVASDGVFTRCPFRSHSRVG